MQFGIRIFIAILTFSLGLAAHWGLGARRAPAVANFNYHRCHHRALEIAPQSEIAPLSDKELSPCYVMLPTYPGQRPEDCADDNAAGPKAPQPNRHKSPRAH